MEKNSSFFEPSAEIVDDIYQWAKYEYLSRLLPRIDSWINRIEKNKLILNPGYEDYGDMSKLLETKRWILENMEMPKLQSVENKKLSCKVIYEVGDHYFEIIMIFRDSKQKISIELEDQRSAFCDENKIIDLFFPFSYLRYFTINHIKYALRSIKSDIDHECSHLRQYFGDADRLIGLPPKGVREENADIEGCILEKKHSGKTVRRNRQIEHGQRDIEFWPNLRTITLKFRNVLQEYPLEDRKKELYEMINYEPAINVLKIDSSKRKLFLKHLISNLQDLL